MRFSAIQRALAMGQVGPAAALLRDVEAAAAVNGAGTDSHGLLITVEGAPEPLEALPEGVDGPMAQEAA